MSFAIPYLFRNSVKKKREHIAHQHSQLSSTTFGIVGCSHGSNNASNQHNNTNIEHSTINNREQQQQTYPTLISMVQAKAAASPDPSPSSSTSSRSRSASIAHPPTVPLEPEELEHNRFYRYIRSHFNLIFSRSSVVCVPHSRSLEGLILTKDFIGNFFFILFLFTPSYTVALLFFFLFCCIKFWGTLSFSLFAALFKEKLETLVLIANNLEKVLPSLSLSLSLSL